jgi:hypothetical protein
MMEQWKDKDLKKKTYPTFHHSGFVCPLFQYPNIPGGMVQEEC